MTSTATGHQKPSTPDRAHVVAGVDHIAYPTSNPVDTVEFYNEVLGFPIAHAITAKGWGPADHPDFVHFFFDIGHGNRLAFFYYFGHPEWKEELAELLRHSSRHVALHVDSPDDLDEYERRLNASRWPVHMRVAHETIESIYTLDPNDYLIEFTVGLRELGASDTRDAELSVRAMVEVVSESSSATMADMWRRKAELIAGEGER